MKIGNEQTDFEKLLNKPLSAEICIGESPVLKEPRLIANWVFWLEQRPNEAGRTTAVIRPWGESNSSRQELTPAPINLKTRVHGYGGAPVALASEDDQILIAWIDGIDDSLWFQSWEPLPNKPKKSGPWLKAVHEPRCLTAEKGISLAGGLIDISRNLWIGVMEKGGRDYVVSLSLSVSLQSPDVIHLAKDFVGYPALSANRNQLAWVEWQAPCMPWTSSELWCGELDAAGVLKDKRVVLGSCENESSESISVFQPLWLSNGNLVVTEDKTGWWNVILAKPSLDSGEFNNWERPWSMEAESAMPQWLLGMSTISEADNKIVALICKEGLWQIAVLFEDGLINTIKQPFDDLYGLDAEGDKVVLVGSNSFQEYSLLEVDLNLEKVINSQRQNPNISKSDISIGESFWFEGYNNNLTHAWYYSPINCKYPVPPLLVKCHSGPTAMSTRGLNLSIQFWTSRGWSVLDVNYGGSTGFGKGYRQRLDNLWGIVDVIDCKKAVNSLISEGRANPEMIAIEGGSAGGFTALSCLCLTDTFRVGACKYPVSDLLSMAQETHRFEKGYLDELVGKFELDFQSYKDRSPIENLSNFSSPVIIFQGMKDRVVLYDQTKRLVDELKRNNAIVDFNVFPDEGHGFRSRNVRMNVLCAMENFFNKHLLL